MRLWQLQLVIVGVLGGLLWVVYKLPGALTPDSTGCFVASEIYGEDFQRCVDAYVKKKAALKAAS